MLLILGFGSSSSMRFLRFLFVRVRVCHKTLGRSVEVEVSTSASSSGERDIKLDIIDIDKKTTPWAGIRHKTTLYCTAL